MASSFTALPVVGLKKIRNIIGELLSKAFALFAVVYFFLEVKFLLSCICSLLFNNLSFSTFSSLFSFPASSSVSPFPGVCWWASLHAVLCHEAANGEGSNRRDHRRGPLLPERGQTHQTADWLQDIGQYTHTPVDTDTYLLMEGNIKQMQTVIYWFKIVGWSVSLQVKNHHMVMLPNTQ